MQAFFFRISNERIFIMKQKIVFFDIDGTLIDMQAKKITPKMLETLHRLQDRGIKICIATGRSPMVLPKIDGVAFDAYLTFNGSLCYDRKGVIFSNPIPHKDVVRFIQNAAALGRQDRQEDRQEAGSI